MEVTEEQFIENLNGMPEEEQQVVLGLMDQVEMSDLETFAKALGVTVIGLEEDEEQPEEGEEAPVAEEPAPTEPVPAEPAVEEAPAEPASILPPPAAPAPAPELPIDQEMQALALGDEVENPAEIPEEPVLEEPAAEVVGPIDSPQGEAPAQEASGVADQVPMTGKEGDFILTSAAVKRQGIRDLKERHIKKAIESAKEDGVEISMADITKPGKQLSGDVDYLASNGEWRIPEVLVKYIGLDVLEKMNASAEEETEKKLAEQEQKPAKGNIPVRAA